MAQLAEHPKGSTVCADDEGSYVAYHRVCRNCTVELTSRNRGSGGALKCKTCQASDARVIRREATGWPNRMGRPPAELRPEQMLRTERHSESHHKVSPERQRVHALLTKFLLYPTLPAMKDALLAALVDYEIKDRFRFL